MKGIVFTEFLEFVASRYGDDVVDDLIEACGLPNGGAYTAVGTYDHEEMTALCQALSQRTGEPVAELTRRFGARLSESFAAHCPDFFSRSDRFFDFLESIEAHIHKEVRKLYPGAELPSFRVHARTEQQLVLDYRSPRRMSALAEGLITGSASRFGVTAGVRTEALDDGDGRAVRIFVDIQ